MLFGPRRTPLDLTALQDRESRRLRIQLLDKEDPSVNEDSSAVGRWREYVASFVLQHPTEWLPVSRRKRRAVFLKR